MGLVSKVVSKITNQQFNISTISKNATYREYSRDAMRGFYEYHCFAESAVFSGNYWFFKKPVVAFENASFLREPDGKILSLFEFHDLIKEVVINEDLSGFNSSRVLRNHNDEYGFGAEQLRRRLEEDQEKYVQLETLNRYGRYGICIKHLSLWHFSRILLVFVMDEDSELRRIQGA